MPVVHFDGTGAKCFSWLINKAIQFCPDELVIIASDKVNPIQSDVDRLVSLLDKGYGLVGLYRFGFFGFYKHLIKKIGWFDERYVSGGYEDCDIVRRLNEANIAYWEEESVKYLHFPSSWQVLTAQDHFKAKWEDTNEYTCTRKLPEEKYDYDIGHTTPREFRYWTESKLLPHSQYFLNVRIK
jgi:hypothetical protein